MLVTSPCAPIILNARRYFHKRLRIQSHILYDSYHTSPLIQAALNVSALNTSMGLNLLKCAAFATDFCFFYTPAQRRVVVRREASNWKTSIVLAAEHSGSLGSVQGIGPAELCHGRQVAGTAEWKKECGGMEGYVIK